MFERALVRAEVSPSAGLLEILATERRIGELQDTDARAWHQAQFELVLGQLSVPSAGNQASRVRVLHALDRARRDGLVNAVPRLLLNLSRWELHEGRVEEAVGRIEEALREAERTAAAAGELQRSEASSFMTEMAHALEPLLAREEVSPARTLLLAEGLQAMKFGTPRVSGPDLLRLQKMAPERSAVLILLSLRQRVAVWTLSRQEVTLHVIPNRARLLSAAADVAGLPPGRGERSDIARLVSDSLLRPVFEEVSAAQTVAVVADPELSNLPFASLPRPDNGAPWGAGTEIVSAPR